MYLMSVLTLCVLFMMVNIQPVSTTFFSSSAGASSSSRPTRHLRYFIRSLSTARHVPANAMTPMAPMQGMSPMQSGSQWPAMSPMQSMSSPEAYRPNPTESAYSELDSITGPIEDRWLEMLMNIVLIFSEDSIDKMFGILGFLKAL